MPTSETPASPVKPHQTLAKSTNGTSKPAASPKRPHEADDAGEVLGKQEAIPSPVIPPETEFELEFSRPKNRGKKLRVVVEQPISSLTLRPTLWPLVQFSDDTEVNIWRLPETHQDLLTIDPIKATFRSRHTQLLSKELFKIIEDNGPFLRSLSILSNILQGDDVCYPATLLQTSLSSPELAQCRLVTEEMNAILYEYLERLHDIRRLLIKAHLQKKRLAVELNIFRDNSGP
ncbi:hypothetical protein HDV03_004941 [Kappamyces sp. JEL0829]|nr:hypothetical protein HDV03_004941 [Kappamyces sp. JEL0829]